MLDGPGPGPVYVLLQSQRINLLSSNGQITKSGLWSADKSKRDAVGGFSIGALTFFLIQLFFIIFPAVKHINIRR